MEKMWFYAQGQQKNGPIPETELRALIQSGTVTPADLVWTEGMANWAQAGTLSEPGSPATSTASPAVAAVQASMPPGLLGWMSFVGVLNIVYGAMSCLSCVGIITGVFFIISGTALVGARKALEGAGAVDARFMPFLNKIKLYMQMTGVMYLIALVLTIVLMIIYAGVIAALLAGGLHN